MLGILMLAAVSMNLHWSSYANDRYGYSTCYPAAWFRAGAESGSRDGRVFQARDGAEIRVFGRYDQESLIDAVNEESEPRDGYAARVTYRVVRANWAVVSGFRGNKTFWTKIMRNDDRFAIIQLTHPTAATRYRVMPSKLMACSQLGEMSY